MHINVTVISSELEEMDMTREQLQANLVETLHNNACDVHGKDIDFSGFTVTVEVMPTLAEFSAMVNGQPPSSGKKPASP